MEKQAEKKEFIRISDSEIRITIRVYDGMEEGIYVLFSPSLNVSGYGKTPKEAEETFHQSIIAFATDLKNLSNKKKGLALLSLGWSKEKLKQKNYSHAFVDSSGVLNNLGIDLEELRESELELTV